MMLLNILFAITLDDPSLIEYENRFKKEVEEKIQKTILDRMLGEGLSSVIVSVELKFTQERGKGQVLEKKTEKTERMPEPEYLAPYIPLPQSATNPPPPKEAKAEIQESEKQELTVKLTVSRFHILVLYDSSFKPTDVQPVKVAIEKAYERYRPIVELQPFKFQKINFSPVRFLNSFLDPVKFLLTLLAILLLMFLFGPLRSFFRNLIAAMKEGRGIDVDVASEWENPEEEAKEGETEGAGGLGAAGELLEEEKRYQPFWYVNDENVKKLKYLLRREEPDVIVVVLSYLKDEYVKEILASFPPDLQAKVGVSMTTLRSLTMKEVKAIDDMIKEKIDFLVGGAEKLLAIFDELDYTTRENILDYLRNEKPELYEKIRRYIIQFEDIKNFPDQVVQRVLEKIDNKVLAVALVNADAELVNKVMANMPRGRVVHVKEEMELLPQMTEKMILEERKKIVSVIKELEAKGEIAFRDFNVVELIEAQAKELKVGLGAKELPVAKDPQLAYEYFVEGSRAYEEGRFTDAVQYFNSSIQYDNTRTEAFLYLGFSYYSINRYEDALKAFERAYELDPTNATAKEWLEHMKNVLT